MLFSCNGGFFQDPVVITPQAIGVDISERKSGTERTKKRKKLELVFFTTRGRNWYCSTSSRRYTDFAEP